MAALAAVLLFKKFIVPIEVAACEKVRLVGVAPVKIAVAVGTPAGDQFAVVSQSAPGPAQVALWAWTALAPSPRLAPAISAVLASKAARSRAVRGARAPRPHCVGFTPEVTASPDAPPGETVCLLPPASTLKSYR